MKLNPGDLVEVYNGHGSTQAMVWPTMIAQRNQTFMLFAYPTGAVGNTVGKGVNELIIPNYKQTWGNIRIAGGRAPDDPSHVIQAPGVHAPDLIDGSASCLF